MVLEIATERTPNLRDLVVPDTERKFTFDPWAELTKTDWRDIEDELEYVSTEGFVKENGADSFLDLSFALRLLKPRMLRNSGLFEKAFLKLRGQMENTLIFKPRVETFAEYMGKLRMAYPAKFPEFAKVFEGRMPSFEEKRETLLREEEPESFLSLSTHMLMLSGELPEMSAATAALAYLGGMTMTYGMELNERMQILAYCKLLQQEHFVGLEGNISPFAVNELYLEMLGTARSGVGAYGWNDALSFAACFYIATADKAEVTKGGIMIKYREQKPEEAGPLPELKEV